MFLFLINGFVPVVEVLEWSGCETCMLNIMTNHDLSHKIGSKQRTSLVNDDVSLPTCVWSRLNDVNGLHCIDDAVNND